MSRILKTSLNPYGLSQKQRLVISDLVSSMKQGKGFNAAISHQKVYSVKNVKVAAVMAYENLNRPNFREALYKELEYCGVFGVSGKIVQCLSDGLNATHHTDFGEMPDYIARLRYIQEIFKLIRIY